jgi:hypothetical protein
VAYCNVLFKKRAIDNGTTVQTCHKAIQEAPWDYWSAKRTGPSSSAALIGRRRFNTTRQFGHWEADLVPCLNSMRPTFVRYQWLIWGR